MKFYYVGFCRLYGVVNATPKMFLTHVYTHVNISSMNKVNALELRQSMGKVIDQILKTGEPILLEKSRRPVAVIISIRDYEERFVEKDAANRRREIIEGIENMARPSLIAESVVDVIHESRNVR